MIRAVLVILALIQVACRIGTVSPSANFSEPTLRVKTLRAAVVGDAVAGAQVIVTFSDRPGAMLLCDVLIDDPDIPIRGRFHARTACFWLLGDIPGEAEAAQETPR